MTANCHRVVLALGFLVLLVAGRPNSPRTNNHFNSGFYGSADEDSSLMGIPGRSPSAGETSNPGPGTNYNHASSGRNIPNDGGYNRVNGNYGNERTNPNENFGLRDEWNNNYRSNNIENARDSNTNYNANGTPESNRNNPGVNRPYNPNGRGDNGDVNFGSRPGITMHRMNTVNTHIRPPTPNSYTPISAQPHSPIAGLNIEPAFKGCERHPNIEVGQMVGGHYETKAQPMLHQSHIAVYPLIDGNSELMVKIMMPSRQYQISVQGTNVKLEKCDQRGSQCSVEDEKATKSKTLIESEKWNYIYSQLSSNSVTVGIGGEVKVMSMRDIPDTDLEHAEWLVMSGDGGVRGVEGRPDSAGGAPGGGGHFVVQHPCAEYVAAHLIPTPSPHPRTDNPFHAYTGHHEETDLYPSSTYVPNFTGAIGGYTTEMPEKDGNTSAALIVGIIGALVLVGLVIAIIISVVKKRRSLTISESTPLSEQKKSEPMEQQHEQKAEDVQRSEK